MKTNYLVTIDTDRNVAAPTEDRVNTAVWNCQQHPEDFLSVMVKECKGEDEGERVRFRFNLFAIAEKGCNGEWDLINYFYTQKRAFNAAKKARQNLSGCGLNSEIAVLSYDGTLRRWMQIG